MKVLVDTSVWSLALRRRAHRETSEVIELRRLIDEGRVVMVGAVRQELLSGVRDELQFARLREQLRWFPDVPLNEETYENAARHSNVCRADGVQGSHTDFLLCAVSLDLGAPILTTDRDFQHYARCLPLRLHAARAS